MSTSSTSTPNNNPSIGEDLYSGVATLGRIRAVISAVIFGLIAIALLIGGILKLVNAKDYKPQPNDEPDAKFNLEKQGLYMILAAGVIVLLISTSLYLTMRYKAIAAIGGAEGIAYGVLRR